MINPLTICIIIFVLTLASYFANFVPMEITALGSMVLLMVFGCLEPAKALSAFSNPNTIVMAAMFVVAAGFNRTQMIKKVSGFIYKIGGGSFNKMLAGYLLIVCVLTQFVPSPMVVFSIIFPMALGMCQETGESPSRAMFPLALVSVACCGVFPVGAFAVEYAKYNGFLESFNYTTYQVGFFDVLMARLPILIMVMVYAIFISPKIAPKEMVIGSGQLKVKGPASDPPPLSPVREVVGYGVFVLVTLGLIFQSKIGLANWQICTMGAVIVVAFGVLSREEATKSMNLWIVLMYVGALCMGYALDGTGAGAQIGNLLAKMVGGTTNSYIIGALFFAVPFIVTQFMLNQAVMNVFIPICILACQALGCNPVGPIILVNAACLTAFFTPMATPVIPMMMAAGGYDLKGIFKQGWLLAILMCVVSVLWTMTIFPAFP